MPAFIIPNRDQMLLLTQVDLSTVAAEGSVVSLLNELIDSLDTEAIEAGYQVDSDTGRPPFHSKTLLKVALLALQAAGFRFARSSKILGGHLSGAESDRDRPSGD